MSEKRVKEKRLTARNVGIALGIICIILGMSLSWTIDIYNGTNASLKSQITNLQSQVTDITYQLNLDKSTVWVNNQTVNNFVYWIFSTNYSGYVNLQIEYANPSTWITVDYMYYASPSGYFPSIHTLGSGYGPVNFNFPVVASSTWHKIIPSSPVVGVQVTIGNITSTNVTITYYY